MVNEKEAGGVDLDAVNTLVAALQCDVKKLRGDSPDIQRSRMNCKPCAMCSIHRCGVPIGCAMACTHSRFDGQGARRDGGRWHQGRTVSGGSRPHP